MTTTPLNLLLADDDMDDCFFFKEALEELPVSAKLTREHRFGSIKRHWGYTHTLLKGLQKVNGE